MSQLTLTGAGATGPGLLLPATTFILAEDGTTMLAEDGTKIGSEE